MAVSSFINETISQMGFASAKPDPSRLRSTKQRSSAACINAIGQSAASGSEALCHAALDGCCVLRCCEAAWADSVRKWSCRISGNCRSVMLTMIDEGT